MAVITNEIVLCADDSNPPHLSDNPLRLARLVRQGPDAATLDLTLRIRPGWHVNTHRPLQAYLIPTALRTGPGWTLTEIEYPQAEVITLGFQTEPLALYQGEVHIRAKLRRPGSPWSLVCRPAASASAWHRRRCGLPPTSPSTWR